MHGKYVTDIIASIRIVVLYLNKKKYTIRVIQTLFMVNGIYIASIDIARVEKLRHNAPEQPLKIPRELLTFLGSARYY
jgi:uncharacterized membrane-anchored protein YitT (DUF2179 family)